MSVPNCGSLTVDRLHEVLHYDPETGVFTWKVRLSTGKGPGDTAGARKKDGYIRVQIDKESYTASRLAWLYINGKWPDDKLDHKNRDRADNKWKNLRPATSRQNNQNRKVSRLSGTGCKGVSWFANRWQVAIKNDGQQVYVGRYSCLLDAVAARLRAERELFTHHREN